MVLDRAATRSGDGVATTATTVAPDRPDVRRSSPLSVVALTFASNAVLPLTALVTGPLLARTLGPSGRGTLAALLAPLALAPMLASFGLTESATVHVGARRRSRRDVLRAGLPLSLAAGAAAGLGIWLIAPWQMSAAAHHVVLLRVAAVTVVASVCLNLVRATLLGAGRYRTLYVERALGAASRLVLLVLAALAGWLTVTSALWITVGTGLLAALTLLTVRTRRSDTDGDRRDVRRLRGGLARYGAHAWGGSVAGPLDARLDQALLLPLIGASELGLYVVAVTLAEATDYLGDAVRQLVLGTTRDGTDAAFAVRAIRVLVLVVSMLAAVGIATAPVLVRTLFGPEFSGAVPLARILFVAAIAGAASHSLSAALLIIDRPGRQSLAQFASLGVTAVGIAVLVPAWGATGAAVASGLAYTTSAVIKAVFLSRATGIGVRRCIVPTAADVRWLVRCVAALSRRAVASVARRTVRSSSQPDWRRP